jgi:hypothetical protein
VKTFSRGRGRLAGAVAITAGLLVPLATFGAPALAKSGAAASEYQYGGSGSSQYQYRVTICHLTGSKKHPAHTITVGASAVKAHLRHGDHLGPCTGTEKRKPKHHSEGSAPTSAAPTAPHQGHGNGNGDDHGKGHHK